MIFILKAIFIVFFQYKKLVLLQIESNKLKTGLGFEESSSEERKGKFPHLYGKLTTQDVINTWRLDRCGFELPKQVLVESEKNSFYDRNNNK